MKRIAVRENSTLYYFLSDHLGSTAITVEDDGDFHSELRYSAWGETREEIGETPTSRRFTGQAEDSYINLYWMGSRWYDPELGRFLSPDSIVPDKGNPLGLDRYAYVANNPISRVDASGHCWGVASFIRGIPTYNTTCNNLEMALTIVQSDKTSTSDKVVAGAYITGEVVAHGTAVVYGAITACGLASAACYAAITGGSAACADGNCTNEVEMIPATGQAIKNTLQPLVYGPSSGGRLREFADKVNGLTLTDFSKPPDLSWIEFSRQTLDKALSAGQKVYFDLTNMQNIQGVLKGAGEFANTITAQELRYIYANWDKFKNVVTFFQNGKEVTEPW